MNEVRGSQVGLSGWHVQTQSHATHLYMIHMACRDLGTANCLIRKGILVVYRLLHVTYFKCYLLILSSRHINMLEIQY